MIDCRNSSGSRAVLCFEMILGRRFLVELRSRQEGRDYRSVNAMIDTPESLTGTNKEWKMVSARSQEDHSNQLRARDCLYSTGSNGIQADSTQRRKII